MLQTETEPDVSQTKPVSVLSECYETDRHRHQARKSKMMLNKMSIDKSYKQSEMIFIDYKVSVTFLFTSINS